jgi:hypothetical protein
MPAWRSKQSCDSARTNERPIFGSISGQSENTAAQESRNSAENGARRYGALVYGGNGKQ